MAKASPKASLRRMRVSEVMATVQAENYSAGLLARMDVNFGVRANEVLADGARANLPGAGAAVSSLRHRDIGRHRECGRRHHGAAALVIVMPSFLIRCQRLRSFIPSRSAARTCTQIGRAHV